MTLPQTPAEAFPPGEYLRDELEERGWTVTEFADIIGRPVQAVSAILDDKKSIAPDTALSLSEALGTSAGVWLNLQAAYHSHQRRIGLPDCDTNPSMPLSTALIDRYSA